VFKAALQMPLSEGNELRQTSVISWFCGAGGDLFCRLAVGNSFIDKAEVANFSQRMLN